MRLYRLAAEQGYEHSMFNLGTLLASTGPPITGAARGALGRRRSWDDTSLTSWLLGGLGACFELLSRLLGALLRGTTPEAAAEAELKRREIEEGMQWLRKARAKKKKTPPFRGLASLTMGASRSWGKVIPNTTQQPSTGVCCVPTEPLWGSRSGLASPSEP